MNLSALNMTEQEQQQTIKQANELAPFLSFLPTWLYKNQLLLPHRKVYLSSGNQFGKSSSAIHSCILSVMGSHPVPNKNIMFFKCHDGDPDPDKKWGTHHFTRPAPWLGYHVWGLQPGQCFWNDHEKRTVPRITNFPNNMICPECGKQIVLHQRESRVIRLCSENLPEDKEGSGAESAETRNKTYPEFKKYLPPFLLKRDITSRNKTMLVLDPNTGCQFGDGSKAFVYKGKDIVAEFVSYNQGDQAGAGVQRPLILFDEEPPWSFFEEQMPRLVAEDGSYIIALTPANRSSWTFGELFENAEVYIRTKHITDYYESIGEGGQTRRIQKTKMKSGIAVLQAATDDNPTLTKRAIDELFVYDDPDTVATRRFGIHRQATGRIFKDFDLKIHVIKPDKWFPDGIPHSWTHARAIDVHPKVNWACVCAAISPQNEMFVWTDLWISPENNTTLQIMRSLANECQDYSFVLHLCDPEAETIKKDTISVLDDMRRICLELKREGIGTGGYWMTWDTKGERGRDQIKARLKGSRLAGRPFNNKVVKEGRTEYLPTIWVYDTCKTTIEHMRKWSWEQWVSTRKAMMSDANQTPQQKYSHMNMSIEALLKHPSFSARNYVAPTVRHEGKQYYKARGR